MIVKLGWATQTDMKILVASLVSGTISASISPSGSVDVMQYTDRHGGGNFIGVGYVTFSGLSAGTRYTYTITSGTEAPVSGSFTTAPKDYRCSFIVSSCDSDERRTAHRPFAIIKALAQGYASQGVPFSQIHVGNPAYVGTGKTNVAGWPAQTYSCQSEGKSNFYARGWAKWLGLFPNHVTWSKDEDRQWVYQNVPSHVVVGSQGFASNFSGVPIQSLSEKAKNAAIQGDWAAAIAADGKSWTKAQLEAAALPEVKAWVSAIGAPVGKAGELYSSASYGPVKIFHADMQLRGAAQSEALFWPQQISAMLSALDVSTHPMKLLTMEGGVSQYGQAWAESSPTEANGWHTAVAARANLNGTNGHLFIAYGDSYSRHVISYENFWAFSAGILQDSSEIEDYATAQEKAASLAFGGKLRWADGAILSAGDNPISGFWLFDAFSDHIEARYIDGANGNILYGPVQLIYAQTSNQWQKMISQKTT